MLIFPLYVVDYRPCYQHFGNQVLVSEDEILFEIVNEIFPKLSVLKDTKVSARLGLALNLYRVFIVHNVLFCPLWLIVSVLVH